MIFHSFKLFWNQKRKYAYILIEVFALYIMLVFCFAYIGQIFYRYSQKPGYNWEKVIALNIKKIEVETDPVNVDQNYESTVENIAPNYNTSELFESQLNTVTGIQGITRVIEATPYFLSMWSLSLKYNDIQSTAVIHIADANYQGVMNYKMLSGQWYTRNMENESTPPMVIDKILAEKFFGSASDAIGKLIEYEKRNFKICGVCAEYKRMDNEDFWPCFFIPISSYEHADNHTINYLIKFKTNDKYPFKEIERSIYTVVDPQKWEISLLNSLETMRQEIANKQRIEIISVIFVCAILLVTALLGIIGIFSYSINRRKSEIGLRRATGATLNSIWIQLITEMLFVSIVAILPAMIILIQIPLLGNFEDSSMITFFFSIFGVGIILLVMILAAVFYPAYKASRIEPALALKDE